MFPDTSTWLIVLLLIQLAIANPVRITRSPVTVPMSRRTNFTSVHNLLRHDQTRAIFLKAGGSAVAAGHFLQQNSIVNEPIDNQAVNYVATVGVGSPPTEYSLLIDTGSSNTWIGASKPYVPTQSGKMTGNEVSVQYGVGSFSGNEYIDQVTLYDGLVIPEQSIGVANTSKGFDGVDGILGIGPTDLTFGTLSDGGSVPTVVDNLFANSAIDAYEIGVSFEPTDKEDNVNGELTWGGTNPSKFTGPITYIPITNTPPANEFWGIDQSIRYGASTLIQDTTSGIVDTGTTLILLATDAFNKYQVATKATNDSSTGLLTLTNTNFHALQSLFFTTGGTTFELTPNAQLWPRALNTQIGGVAGSIYLVIADMGSSSEKGLDFINGFAFLERFYSVYDTGNQRVGLAYTPFTRSMIN